MSFDLQEALNGAPVKLRNGQKAYVVGLSKLGTEDSNSYIVGEYGRNLCNWSKDGKYWLKRESEWDIVGMYEEPKLTSEQVLEKAFNEDLFVVKSTGVNVKLKVIAKSRDGVFVLEADNGFMSKSCDGEYVLYKATPPRSDTITVTLPKPFKPKEGDVYFCLDDEEQGFILETTYRKCSDFDRKNAEMGQCFRTESDAQAWLDAMKNALMD